MEYPKKRMTIKELEPFGWSAYELRAIYHSELNDDRTIASRQNESSNKSTIKFNVEELLKVKGRF